MSHAPPKSRRSADVARAHAAPGNGSAVERVLFVTGQVLDDSFGHGALRLARELRRRGKDVGLLCGGGPLVAAFRRIGIEPVVAEALHSRGRPLWAPRRVAASVAGFRPQLIHVFGRSLAAWGRQLSRALDCPYVLTVMTLAPRRRHRVRGDWSRGSVLVLSESLREQLVNQSRIPKAVIGVVPFGIALDEYDAYRDAERHDHVPVVGMVGPLVRERGAEVFLHAARHILDGGHEAHFLVAGDGPDRRRLRRLATQLDLRPAVTLVHDFADYRRMLAVLDVCVFPDLREGLSLNVIEAMACGKPVVASGIGSVYSIVDDGKTGLLAPPGDAAGLAEKILRLMDDRALARRIAEAAYEQVRERFSVRASVGRLLEFYSECYHRVENA
ncbi:glycosyltransferase family 4 protein [bacterium]|nr:glycosyltransferase family 4 protein [bacterium]